MMEQAYKALHDKVARLPIEKVGKALSFISYLEQEQEAELVLTDDELEEVYTSLNSDDSITADELAAKIEGLPSDN